MALRLPDKWVWDFWLARDGGEHHIFYLQAPGRSSAPTLRHHNASIGHAVSRDLRHWRVLPDALHPGPEGSWDDLATWTGSVIDHDGRWHMLYTGISRRERGLVQRIGLAVSDDLVHWEKHPANPVLEADARWYDLLDRARWRDQSWRDPWLFRRSRRRLVPRLITARSRHGRLTARASSRTPAPPTSSTWEVLPPLTPPGDFAQVEARSWSASNGRYEHPGLVPGRGPFAASGSKARRHRPDRHVRLLGRRALRPLLPAARPDRAPDGPLGTLYAGKLVEDGAGSWGFMAFRGDGDRDFVGELTDPLPLLHRLGRTISRLVADSRPKRHR